MNRNYIIPFYIPNLIDYLRILLFVIAIANAMTRPIFAASCYFIAAILDGVDGYVARKLNQQSRYGAILDMVIDRVMIASFLCVLILLYKNYWWFFTVILMLDIISHLILVLTFVNDKRETHKKAEHYTSWLLKKYYGSQAFLCLICFLHEAWFGLLYFNHFFPSGILKDIILLTIPGFMVKTYVHLIQGIEATKVILSKEKLETEESLHN